MPTIDDGAAAAAPAEWQKFVDDSSGATYYYNARSGESSWEEPAGFALSPKKDANTKPPQWRRVTDESSGRAYYYDAANGVTQWEAPEGADIADESGGLLLFARDGVGSDGQDVHECVREQMPTKVTVTMKTTMLKVKQGTAM